MVNIRFLVPSLLLCGWPVLDKVGRRGVNHRVRIEIAKGIFLPHVPGQENGKSDFIELNTLAVRGAVNPEVLCKSTVGLLGASEIHQGAQRCSCVITGE